VPAEHSEHSHERVCARLGMRESHARIQPLAYEAHDHAVRHPLAKDRLQAAVIEGVEGFPPGA
jgi:hypothetical protein